MWVPLSIKKNKKNKRDQVVQNQEFVQRAERLVDFFYFFSSKTSLFDSRSSDSRISSDQTRKVLYATRATRENQKHGISSREIVNTYKIVNTYE